MCPPLLVSILRICTFVRLIAEFDTVSLIVFLTESCAHSEYLWIVMGFTDLALSVSQITFLILIVNVTTAVCKKLLLKGLLFGRFVNTTPRNWFFSNKVQVCVNHVVVLVGVFDIFHVSSISISLPFTFTWRLDVLRKHQLVKVIENEAVHGILVSDSHVFL